MGYIDYLPKRVKVDFPLDRLPGASRRSPISGPDRDLHLRKKLTLLFRDGKSRP
jgi:hypothetical protein